MPAQRYNILFGLSCGNVYGPFFFKRENNNVNKIICHDPLELWLMPQLSDGKRNVSNTTQCHHTSTLNSQEYVVG